MPQYPLRHVHDLATSVLQKIEPFDDLVAMSPGRPSQSNLPVKT